MFHDFLTAFQHLVPVLAGIGLLSVSTLVAVLLWAALSGRPSHALDKEWRKLNRLEGIK